MIQKAPLPEKIHERVEGVDGSGKTLPGSFLTPSGVGFIVEGERTKHSEDQWWFDGDEAAGGSAAETDRD